MIDCTAPLALRLDIPSRRPGWFTHSLVIMVSLAGGILGIGGALIGEVRTGGLLLLPFVGAPVIEEAFKPIGLYLSLLRWPRALESRLYRAILCAGAGTVFGLIESAVYVYVYAPGHPDWYPLFRFTIPVALHTIASFTVGLGLDWRVLEWVNRGTRLPKRTRNFYIAGVGIHAAYNTAAVIMAILGVLDF